MYNYVFLTISFEHSVSRYISPSTPCWTVLASTPSFSIGQETTYNLCQRLFSWCNATSRQASIPCSLDHGKPQFHTPLIAKVMKARGHIQEAGTSSREDLASLQPHFQPPVLISTACSQNRQIITKTSQGLLCQRQFYVILRYKPWHWSRTTHFRSQTQVSYLLTCCCHVHSWIGALSDELQWYSTKLSHHCRTRQWTHITLHIPAYHTHTSLNVCIKRYCRQ